MDNMERKLICKCGKQNIEGSKFCAHCGSLLESMSETKTEILVEENAKTEIIANVCPSCKRTLKIGSSFCSFCGTNLQNNKQDYYVQDVHNESTDSNSKWYEKIGIRTAGPEGWIFIGGIVVIAILLVVIVMLVASYRKQKKEYVNMTQNEKVQESSIDETASESGESNVGTDFDAEESAMDEYMEEDMETDADDIGLNEFTESDSDINEFSEVRLYVSREEASSCLNVKSKDGATYGAEHLTDGDYHTAWVEGSDDDGEGEYVILHLNGTCKVSKIVVYNGFLKSKYRYSINGKVLKMKFEFSDGSSLIKDLNVMYPGESEVEFSVSELNPTTVELDEPVETEYVKCTIIDAEQGTKYRDTAISDIEIYGM